MTKNFCKNCVFCTEKQVYFWADTRFYNLTKINIEIRISFVYNVFIAVPCTPTVSVEEGWTFPKGVFDHHVYC